MMTRACMARHGSRLPQSAPTAAPINKPFPGMVNLGLADGHMETANLDDLCPAPGAELLCRPNVRVCLEPAISLQRQKPGGLVLREVLTRHHRPPSPDR